MHSNVTAAGSARWSSSSHTLWSVYRYNNTIAELSSNSCREGGTLEHEEPGHVLKLLSHAQGSLPVMFTLCAVLYVVLLKAYNEVKRTIHTASWESSLRTGQTAKSTEQWRPQAGVTYSQMSHSPVRIFIPW